MKNVRLMAVVIGLTGLGSVAHASEPVTPDDDPVSEQSTEQNNMEHPPGFEKWLGSQCPDGAVVAYGDASTGRLVKVVPCEAVRVKVLANPAAVATFVDAYEKALASGLDGPAGDPQEAELAEHTAEASSPLLLGGLVCGIMAAAPSLIFSWPIHGCERNSASPRAQRRCSNWMSGGSLALGLMCTIGALF